MANAVPSKPAVSRLRKWSGRFALMGLLLVLAAVAWVVGGREIVGRMALDWARGRLERQLQESRQQLPEIADFEALLKKEVKGTNGWEHIEAGCKATMEIELRNRSDQESVFSTTWHGGLADAWDAERDSKETGGLGRIRPARMSFVLSETVPLAEHARQASLCGCIVDTETYSNFVASRESGKNKYLTMVPLDKFVGVLITRAHLLARTGNQAKADEEIRVLVTLASKLNVRHSKQRATGNIGLRNDVLEHGVVPFLRLGTLSATTRDMLLATRWQTPGKDPQLWLNNVACAYDYLHCGLTNKADDFFWIDRDSPFVEARFVLAHADWMDVATKNAQAAKRGELDLRDKDWVKNYNAQFESPFALVNGVVPCGRETMSRLVAEVEREDKLWAEIEALAK